MGSNNSQRARSADALHAVPMARMHSIHPSDRCILSLDAKSDADRHAGTLDSAPMYTRLLRLKMGAIPLSYPIDLVVVSPKIFTHELSTSAQESEARDAHGNISAS